MVAALKPDSRFPCTEVAECHLDNLCEVFQVRQAQEIQTSAYFSQKGLDLPRCWAGLCLQDRLLLHGLKQFQVYKLGVHRRLGEGQCCPDAMPQPRT